MEPPTAQVHARYIASLWKVNYRVHRKPWGKPHHRTSGIRLWRSAMIFSAKHGCRMRLERKHVSGGYYGTYLPAGHGAVTTFTPCLLGCRGTI